MCVRHRGNERRIGAEVVQQAALLVWPHDEPVLVLAMNVDERFRQPRKHRRRHCRAVHERPRTPLGTCGPAHEAIAFSLRVKRLLLAQDRERLRLAGNVELGTHIAASGAGANLRPLHPRPKHQRERIEQDGLASAGFAGDHREARAKLDVEPIHQHEVANG